MAREIKDGKRHGPVKASKGPGVEQDGRREPSFIPVFSHKTCNTMTDEQIRTLKEKAAQATTLASKFGAFSKWAYPDVLLIKALIAWGLGGTESSSIATLSAAAAAADEHSMYFVSALSHLYAAVLMHKASAMKEAVDKELRLAVQGGRSPNFASRMAHQYLDTAD